MVMFVACMAAVVMWPSTASAQHYGGHAFVVVGGGFYRPYFYPFYSGWYPAWYPFYPSYYPPYGYWYGGNYASVRLEVTPKAFFNGSILPPGSTSSRFTCRVTRP
jgi:hypothetical protein